MNAPGKLTKSVVGGAAWTSAGAMARGVLRLVTLAILARLLAPGDFGMVAAIAVIIQLSQTLGLIGLAPALIQRKHVSEADIATAQTLALALTVTLALLNAVFAPQIAALFRLPDLVPLLQAASVIFVFQGVTAVARARMDRELAFRRAAMIELSAALFGYSAVSIGFALAGFGVWALVLGQIAQTGIAMAIMLWFYPPVRRLLVDRKAARGLVRFGGVFSIGLLIDRIAGQIDYIIISRTLGADALGLYSRAYQLMAGQARMASQSLSRVLFPALAKLQDEPERLAQAYRRALSVALVPMAVASVFAWLFAEEIVAVILGPKWEDAAEPFRWLGVAMLPRGAARINGALLKATGRVAIFTGVAGLYLLSVSSAAVLAAPYGIDAVARAVALALWLHLIVASIATVYVHGIPMKVLLQGGQAAAVLALVVFLSVTFAERDGFVTAAHPIYAAICGAIALVLAGLILPERLLGPDASWLRAYMRERVLKR